MKFKKNTNSVMGGYVTPDGRFTLEKVTKLHAFPYWSLEDRQEKTEKRFRTKKEASEYLKELYETV